MAEDFQRVGVRFGRFLLLTKARYREVKAIFVTSNLVNLLAGGINYPVGFEVFLCL